MLAGSGAGGLCRGRCQAKLSHRPSRTTLCAMAMRHGMCGAHKLYQQQRTLGRALAAPPHCAVQHAARCAARRSAATPAAAASADAAALQPWKEDWDAMGPAFKATLGLLEWPEFCEYVSDFANTSVGKRLCRQLEVPLDQPTSERLLAEARWVHTHVCMHLAERAAVAARRWLAAAARAARGRPVWSGDGLAAQSEALGCARPYGDARATCRAAARALR